MTPKSPRHNPNSPPYDTDSPPYEPNSPPYDTNSPWYESFRLVPRTDGETAVVELHGEFDVLSAAPLAACLNGLIDRGHHDLVVDLRPAGFVDCSTLGVLSVAAGRLRCAGRPLKVVVTRPLTVRILRLCGLHRAFRLSATLPGEQGSGPGSGVGSGAGSAEEPDPRDPRECRDPREECLQARR